MCLNRSMSILKQVSRRSRVKETLFFCNIFCLVPPNPPDFYFVKSGAKQEIVNSTLKIVKGDDVSIVCNSTGKPHTVSVLNEPGSSDT